MKNEELEKEILKLRGQITDLVSLLGFCAYPDGSWVSDKNPFMLVTSGFIDINYQNQPVKQRDFQLLLRYLKLKIKKEERIPEKIIPEKVEKIK